MSTTHPDLDRQDTRRDVTAPVKALDVAAMVLMIIGGINWGLVGLFNLDVVAALFGTMSTLSRVIYCLVGLAAIYGIVTTTHLLRRMR